MFAVDIQHADATPLNDYPVIKVGTITGRVILYTAPGEGVVLYSGNKIDGWKQYAQGSYQTGLNEANDVVFQGDLYINQ